MKRILLAGATGNLGPYLVEELTARGHDVRALVRPETFQNKEKVSRLEKAGVQLFEGDLTDSENLKKACQDREVVISALGAGQIMQQVELAKAAKAAGVARFVPSEFGIDPIAAGPGACDLFDMKAAVQQEIRNIGIPLTPIYSNGFMEFWVSGLGQLGPTQPPETVQVFGDGHTLACVVALADIARYVHAIIEDPSTLDREIIIQPQPATQLQMIDTWESISGHTVQKERISDEALQNIIAKSNTPETMMQRVFTQLHRSVWISGHSTIKRATVINAVEKYPQIKPMHIKSFLANFI